jgi:hypothetical protein
VKSRDRRKDKLATVALGTLLKFYVHRRVKLSPRMWKNFLNGCLSAKPKLLLARGAVARVVICAAVTLLLPRTMVRRPLRGRASPSCKSDATHRCFWKVVFTGVVEPQAAVFGLHVGFGIRRPYGANLGRKHVNWPNVRSLADLRNCNH